MWARPEGTETVSTNAKGRCATNLCYFCGVLNAFRSLIVLEEGRCAHEQIIQSGWDSDVFMGNNLVDL
jgi:hypothetical protein